MSEDFIDEIEDYDDSPVMQRFVVDNPTKADWCVKRIQDAEAEYARLKEIAEAEIADLQKMLAEAAAKRDRRVAGLKALLYPFFQSVEKKETKTQQSYKLLHGSLVWKKPAMKLVQPDEEALVDYLSNNHPEYVKTIFKPAWGEFKKELTLAEDGTVVNALTGETVELVKAEEVPGEFTIK